MGYNYNYYLLTKGRSSPKLSEGFQHHQMVLQILETQPRHQELIHGLGFRVEGLEGIPPPTPYKVRTSQNSFPKLPIYVKSARG